MRVIETVNEYGLIKSGETVAAALSGGGDSVALLHYLKANEKKLGITVAAVHVEHGIRGESSVSDMDFCKSFCKELGVPLKVYQVDAPFFAKERGVSVETAARELRYRCFESALAEGFCQKIATAHHQSDNAETVLMHLFRGSGVKGACGIPPVRGKYIRPLLETPQSEIKRYLEVNNLKFCEDETNSDQSYTRNFIRKSVLPLVKTRYEGAEGALSGFALRLLGLLAAADAACAPLMRTDGDAVLVKAGGDEALFLHAAQIALEKLGAGQDVGSAMLKRLLGLNRTGASFQFPSDVEAAFEYGEVAFYKKKAPPMPLKIRLQEGGFDFGGVSFEISVFGAETKFTRDKGSFADADALPRGLTARAPANGDIFCPFGMSGAKKLLSDYLTDKKIPLRKRKGLCCLYGETNEALFIPGLEVSDKIKVGTHTKNIIRITTKE